MRMRLAVIGLWMSGAGFGSGFALTVVAMVDGLPWWPHVLVACLGVFTGVVFGRAARVAVLTVRAEQAAKLRAEAEALR